MKPIASSVITVDGVPVAFNLPREFRWAAKMSRMSRQLFRLGCVIVRAGRILAQGFNRIGTTNPLIRLYFGYPTKHAEIDALSCLSKDHCKGATLVVYRETGTGLPAKSKPCGRCMEAIKAYGIKKIMYSTDEWPFYGVMRL
jgi:deoxycytidylate deaminase